jgi:hypothetical protein
MSFFQKNRDGFLKIKHVFPGTESYVYGRALLILLLIFSTPDFFWPFLGGRAASWTGSKNGGEKVDFFQEAIKGKCDEGGRKMRFLVT